MIVLLLTVIIFKKKLSKKNCIQTVSHTYGTQVLNGNYTILNVKSQKKNGKLKKIL